MTPPTGGPSLMRSEMANLVLFVALVLAVVAAAASWKNYADVRASNDRQQQTSQAAADDQKRRSQCLTDWADAYTARTDKVTAATARRNNALDTFLAEIKQPQSPAQRLQKLDAYLAEAAAYRATLKQNPIPESPRLHC